MNISLKHRALAFLAGVTMIVGLGAAAPAPTASAAASGAASGELGDEEKLWASPAGVPDCHAADLEANFLPATPYEDEWGAMQILNVSNHACFTGGYGEIFYVGKGGRQVGAAAVDVKDKMRGFVIQPGYAAIAPMDRLNADNFSRARCRPRRVVGFRVYAPSAKRPLFARFPTWGCANPRVHLLTQEPYIN